MTAEPIWCDDFTPKATGRSVWIELMHPLTARPGHWALIRTYQSPEPAYSAAGHLRRAVRGAGRTKVPAGRFEITSRQIEPDEVGWGIYARYLGPVLEAVPDEENAA